VDKVGIKLEEKYWNCSCKDCQEKWENEQKHLNHPFYKRVDEVTDEVKVEQIIKGAHKYKEPFNPDSWTNLELVRHQLQELRDAQVYSVGLLDRLEKQEKELIDLRSIYECYKDDVKRFGKLTEYIVENHPEIKAGSFVVDAAIEVINSQNKEIEKLKAAVEYWRAVANG
jgi:hypothetical protein